jgi:tetratricopeptide (TPR) repeat protein
LTDGWHIEEAARFDKNAAVEHLRGRMEDSVGSGQDTRETLSYLEFIRWIAPADSRNLYHLAYYYLAHDQYRKAYRYLNKLPRKSPALATFLLAARIYRKQRKFSEVMTIIREAMEKFPSAIEPVVWYLDLIGRDERYALENRDLLETVRNLEPDSAASHVYMAYDAEWGSAPYYKVYYSNAEVFCSGARNSGQVTDAGALEALEVQRFYFRILQKKTDFDAREMRLTDEACLTRALAQAKAGTPGFDLERIEDQVRYHFDSDKRAMRRIYRRAGKLSRRLKSSSPMVGSTGFGLNVPTSHGLNNQRRERFETVPYG